MRKHRFFAVILLFTLVITGCFGGLSTMSYASETSQASVEERPEITLIEDTFYRDDETGHIGIIESEKDDSEAEDDPNYSAVPHAALPKSYGGFESIKETYPCTRDQNPYGTCWAFSATACAEFDMVKNHGMSKESADFSELQLAYNTYHATYDKFGNLYGDQNYMSPYATKSYLDVGGNFVFSRHTLAQWKGYTSEANMPYSWTAYTLNSDNDYGYTSVYNEKARLANVRELDIKNDPASVKQAIMDYGAVYITYGHYSDYYSLNGYSLYYCPYNYGTNHDVAIVGWLDELPASAYSLGPAVPSSNGAWLVRNSWSTNQTVGSEYTYFYMSYDDATLSNTAYALDFEPASTYDNIYQHDGAIAHGGLDTTKAANVFTVEDTGSTSQTLDAVMLSFSYDRNVNYKIQVYTGLTSSTTPTKGYLNSSATTTGWTSEPGIYTVKLKNPVSLQPGEKYSIVVTTLNGEASFDIEYTSSMSYIDSNGYTQSWFDTVADIDIGESFYLYYDTWEDVELYYGTYGYGNLSIKGLTSDSNQLRTPSVKVLNVASTGNIKLTWSKVNGASGYEVYRSTSENGTYTKIATVTGTSFENSKNVTGGNVYYYRVRALHASDSNKHSNYATVSRAKDLPRPTVTLSNRASDGKVKISWKKVSGASKYEVYRATSKSGTYTKIYTTTGTSCINSKNTVAGKVYYYKVRAICGSNSGGNSAYSEVKSRACDLARPTVTVTNRASDGKIKVTWKAVSGASKYEVYRATSKNGTYSKIATVIGTSCINTTNVKAGKVYYYKVKAICGSNSGGNSAYSEVKSRACDLARPVVTLSNRASDGKVKVSWNKISGASKYEVYRATSKNGKYTKIYTTTGTSCINSKNTKAGSVYYYKVKAICESNSGGNSAYSTVQSRACDLARPVVTMKLSSKGKPYLDWTAVSGANKYEVYRATSKNGTYSKVYTTSNSSYINTGAIKGKTYYYKVKAICSKNSGGNSAYSVVKSCTSR